MSRQNAGDALAIHGGPKVRAAPWPARGLFGDEEKRAVVAWMDRAIEAGQFPPYHGPEEEAYCREFADRLGGGYADGVNSGTNALYVALRAMEIEPFSEVIVPPITDPGGVMPVALINCIPVPADAAPNSLNTGADQIAARLTGRTSSVVVAHIAGLPVDMPAVMELARSRGLGVIEDCAQAHGATCASRPVGTFGDVAAFSTMAGKLHVTGGQGGAVFTRSEELYWRVRRHADRGKPFGLAGASGNVVASLNCNMDELHAAIGRVQLRKLPEVVRRRRDLARRIADGCCRRLRTVRLAEPLPGCEGAYWFLLLEMDLEALRTGKQEFVDALAAEGIPVGADYLHAPALAEWFRRREVFGRSGLPWSSPRYRGDPERQYDVPNAVAAEARHFRMMFHERCGEREVADALAAMEKVERACIREDADDH